MNFAQWLKLYSNAAFRETRVSLLSYLEQGNVLATKQVKEEYLHSDITNNIVKRVYA